MRRLLLLLILPAMAMGQIELGPFVFLDDSNARNMTLNINLGVDISGGLSWERPAPEALKFFDFIPGYATRYFLAASAGGGYIDATVISRARYKPKRKIIGFVGLGPGLNVAVNKKAVEIKPTVSVVVGLDYLFSRKFLTHVSISSAGMLTLGIGSHKGYGW